MKTSKYSILGFSFSIITVILYYLGWFSLSIECLYAGIILGIIGAILNIIGIINARNNSKKGLAISIIGLFIWIMPSFYLAYLILNLNVVR